MAVIERTGMQRIGDVAFARGAASGSTDICAAAASAARRNSPAAASLAKQCAALRASSAVKGGSVQASGPGEDPTIPRAALVGAGVVGVLALGFVAYKLTR